MMYILNRQYDDDTNLGDTPINLTEYELLRARGHKAFEFLQGQLTCDIRHVNDKQGVHGLLCDLKGRIQHLVDILFWDNDYYILLPRDLSTNFLKQLRTAATLSRVELTPASQYRITGILHQPTDQTPSPLAVHYDAENTCRSYEIFAGATIEIYESQEAPVEATTRFSLRWQRAILQAAQFRLYPETQGLFLPHRLGLQDSGWIAFDKGCYRGQEIIARTHYRSSIKHGLRTVVLQSSAALFPGMELLCASDTQVMGEIIDCLPKSTNTTTALVSLKLNYEGEALQDKEGNPITMVLP